MRIKLSGILVCICLLACNETKIPEEQNKAQVKKNLEVKTIESVKGNYKVDIPTIFTVVKEDSSTIGSGGDTEAETYSSTCEYKGNAILISAAHYSNNRFSVNSTEEILEQSASEFLKSLQAQSIQYVPVRHGGFEGVEMRFTTTENDTTYYGKARVFIRRPTIYYLTYISTDSVVLNKEETSHFFSSLRSLK